MKESIHNIELSLEKLIVKNIVTIANCHTSGEDRKDIKVVIVSLLLGVSFRKMFFQN